MVEGMPIIAVSTIHRNLMFSMLYSQLYSPSVAHAPRNVHRKIPTLAELENENKSSIPTSEEGLKLGVLISTLVPSNMLYEPDQPWTFESLLRVRCLHLIVFPLCYRHCKSGNNRRAIRCPQTSPSYDQHRQCINKRQQNCIVVIIIC